MCAASVDPDFNSLPSPQCHIALGVYLDSRRVLKDIDDRCRPHVCVILYVVYSFFSIHAVQRTAGGYRDTFQIIGLSFDSYCVKICVAVYANAHNSAPLPNGGNPQQVISVAHTVETEFSVFVAQGASQKHCIRLCRQNNIRKRYGSRG